MSIISEYFQQAELSLAAYAQLSAGMSPVALSVAVQQGGKGMSAKQAEEFAKRWRVVDQYTHSDPFPVYDAITGEEYYDTSSMGMSATVFEDKDGKRYLAVRGTEFGVADILADAILAAGFPSFVNPQFVVLRSKVQAWIDSRVLPTNFSTTGHSLGGYLAAAIGSWYRSGTVYMYNAPGVGGVVGNAYDALKAALGFGNVSLVSDIYNFRGSEGLSVITGLGAQLAPPTLIQIEAAVGGVLGPGNHSVVRLVDAFAVYSMYSQLFPALSLDQIGTLLKSSADESKQTLENALDALRILLLGKQAVEDKPTGTDNRESLYANLYALQESAAYKSLKGSVALRLPVERSREELVSGAKSDFGTFLAVKYLLPVAVEGAGSAIREAHADLYAQWQADRALAAEPREGAEPNYSEEYLADRAAFLTWKLKLAVDDFKPTDGAYTKAGVDAFFHDLDSKLQINLGSNWTLTSEKPRYIFGADQKDGITETLSGGKLDDHLYGDGGKDVLYGYDGDDYLEGGAGEDTLNGGAGLDLLLGGKGADTLDGGEGNDILKGGEGNDTYAFTGSYGIDVVTDSDGSGTIKIDGKTLGSATKTFESIYSDEAAGQRVVRVNEGKSLVVFKEGSGDRVLINDWTSARSLGITLQDTTPTAPAVTLQGDFEKAVDGNDYLFADGNYVSAGQEPGALDLISGTAGNDVIDGGGGDDALSGQAGDDHIEGGDGSDVIQGGLGKDTINGGAGDDALYGSSDEALVKPEKADFARPVNGYPHPQATGFNWTAGYYGTYNNEVPFGYSDAPRNRLAGDQGNRIDGGAGDDFIAAGTGADYVHGGADKDLIYGMDKDDVLFGDGGNDVIYGDGNMPDGSSVVWTLPENHGNDIIDGGSGNDYLFGQGGDDIIFGGDGDDIIRGDDEETVLPVAYHGNDFLFGGAGRDELVGGAGDDYLEGGTGNDTLFGGAGKDIYSFNVGDGVDTIWDTKADGNIIRFGAGVNKDNIKLRLGSLLLDLGNGDAVHIGGFDQLDVFNSSVIGSFEFADGSALTIGELLTRGFDLDGSEASETIYGTNTGDRILGFAGNDVLTGFDGNDVLDGGSGADVLDGGDGDDVLRGGIGNDRVIGGDGDDTYRFGRGDGADALIDSSGVDTLLLGEGISPAGMQVTHFQALDGAYYLDLDFGNGDRVSIQDGALGRLESVVFADGTVYGWRDLIARLPALDVVGTSGGELLPGTMGNDILDGGEGDDTIEAGAGDDVLIGGGGNDVLIGGAGMDTYHFGFGAGTDTVIETGGESSLLVFEPGVMPIQLNLLRDGDDLVIGLRGQTDSMRLKDFHAGGQDWQFRFDGAEPLGFSDLMAAVSPDEGSVAALKNAYKAELMASFSTTMAGYGFKSGHDGSYRKEFLDQTWSGRIKSTEYVESLVFSDQVFDWTRRGLPTESQTSTKDSWVMVAETTGNVAPPPFPGWSFVPRGNASTSRGSRSYDDDYVFVYTGVLQVGTYQGAWNVPDPQSVTGIAMQTFVHEKISHRVETVIPMLEGRDGADGENFYVSYATAHHGYASYASAAGALVDAGSGDDVIRVVSGLGSLVAGRGAFLYGDDGNDSITGGGADDILIGGRGHDVLDGLDGGDAYHLLEEDVGDHIRDSGNDWDRFKAWFYRQHGISDPLLSEEYGGRWIVRADGTWSAETRDELLESVPDWLREYADANAKYVPPLPELPHIAANDYAAMEAWYGKGILREDTLHFGEGVTADNLLVMGCEDPDVLGGLLLHGPQGRLAVVELPRAPVAAGESEPWLEEPPMFGTGIEYYRFADGTVLTLRQMVERMRADHDLIGGGADDVFILDRGNDRVYAGGGNDSLWGGAGDDELDGGAGDDFLDGGSGDDRLSGGEGDDVYRFGWNSGHDVVMEVAGGLNRIVFEEDVSMSDLRLERLANPTRDLVIRLGEEDAASLTIVGWGLSAHGALIDSFQFGETGGFWSTDDILSELRVINSLPDASALPSSITVRAGEPFAYTLPAELFIDVEGDEVTVLVDGDYLPDWMSYDNATRTLCGTPPAWESDSVVSLYLSVGDSYAEDYVSVLFAISIMEASIIDGTEADDRLNGTGRGEILHGNGGDDRLYGRGGDDWLFGGDGNDTLYGGDGDDVLEGDGGNDILHGDAGTDYLSGGDGDDRLNGGSGADDMAGGGGNDIYYVDDEGDSVFEEADNGIDKVVSTIGYTLGDDVENLTLSGSEAIDGTGNDLGNVIVGNAAGNVLSGMGGNDRLTGGAGNDTLDGGDGDDSLSAGDGDDVLLGGTGNDALNGGRGADIMIGGAGNDIYHVDDVGDAIVELDDEGSDRVIATISHTLGDYIENLTLSGTETIDGTGNDLDNVIVGNAAGNVLRGMGGNDRLTGGAGNDTLDGGDGNDSLSAGDGDDVLLGGTGNDTLNGGRGADIMVGGADDDTYYVDDAGDTVVEQAGEGVDRVIASVSHALGEHLENLKLSGGDAIDGFGNVLNNSLSGNAADNLLNGGSGNDSINGAAGLDFLEGMDGDDVLTDTSGRGYFNGGDGADRLTGGADDDFFIGGNGNDTIRTGAGNDIIVFNKGDGYDTLTVGAGDKTLSLGGGLDYGDLRLRKAGNDLVLDTGSGEGMAFRNWYAGTANRNVLTLQVIAEAMAGFSEGGDDPLRDQKVEGFDFKGLADAFDAARAANPGLTTWALADALAQFQLAGSDTAAIGGDLAYQYGRNGTLAGVGLDAARQVTGDTAFGSQAQALRPLGGLQEGAVRLS